MRNLVVRNGTYHFRGYVPHDLVAAGHPRERTESLRTSDHKAALLRRDEKRVAHKRWIEEQRRRRDGRYLALSDVSDQEALALARLVYVSLREHVERQRDQFASRLAHDPDQSVDGYRDALSLLRSGVILGNDSMDAIDTYTREVLEARMIRIGTPEAYEQLRRKVGEAVLQSQVDLNDMIEGSPGMHSNPRFADEASGTARAASGAPDGRPDAKPHAGTALGPLADQYVTHLKLRRQDKACRAVAASMTLLKAVLGSGCDVRTIRRAECNKFLDFVMSLPPNYTKRYKVPVLEIPHIRKPEHGLMSAGNINKIVGHLIGFMYWLREQEVIETCPSFNNMKISEPMGEIDRRPPFEKGKLKTIFGSPEMRSHAQDMDMFFWCWVIGLYQGLRLNEIAKLKAKDITMVEDIPCIDIRLPEKFSSGRSPGKSKTVPRYLPIHRVLIELDLPKFASARPDGAMLFKEAKQDSDGYYSRGISRDSESFLEKIGLVDDGLSFHCLRHTFRDAMRAAGLDEAASAYLGGWIQPGVMNQVYGSRRLHPKLKDDIDRVGYGEIDDLILNLGKKPGHIGRN